MTWEGQEKGSVRIFSADKYNLYYKKKPLDQFVKRLSWYPDPGSNRDGSESTGVWDQRVYRFRHLGIVVSRLRVQRYCFILNLQTFGMFFLIFLQITSPKGLLLNAETRMVRINYNLYSPFSDGCWRWLMAMAVGNGWWSWTLNLKPSLLDLRL